jgi:Transglycosylase SLT domain
MSSNYPLSCRQKLVGFGVVLVTKDKRDMVAKTQDTQDARQSVSASGLLSALFAGFLLVYGAPATADVIDIAPSGTVSTYKGPTQFIGNAATPLVPASQASPTQGTMQVPLSSGITSVFPKQMHPILVGYLNEAAARFNVDPGLVRAVAWQESRFNSEARSPKGAVGIMQLMPATAAQLGVNPHDPRENIHGGVAYLSTLLTQFNGDIRLALAAYNAGPAAVRQYGGIPPYRETQAYVKSIAERIALR